MKYSYTVAKRVKLCAQAPEGLIAITSVHNRSKLNSWKHCLVSRFENLPLIVSCFFEHWPQHMKNPNDGSTAIYILYYIIWKITWHCDSYSDTIWDFLSISQATRGAGQKNFEPHLFTPFGAWTSAPPCRRRSRCGRLGHFGSVEGDVCNFYGLYICIYTYVCMKHIYLYNIYKYNIYITYIIYIYIYIYTYI